MSKKKIETLDEVNQKALDCGMSYGKYVAKLTCQQLRDGTLPKYDHIETADERIERLYKIRGCKGVFDNTGINRVPENRRKQ